MSGDERRTDSGIELQPVYTARRPRRPGLRPRATSARPGSSRSRGASIRRCTAAACGRCASTPAWRPPTRRTPASATCSSRGRPGLSVAFDLPTQMGLDSDHPRAEGEVGKTGVAIDSVEDMARLLDGIPLDRVSTSMTINATAPILLLLYELVAEEQGVPSTDISGTVQNDILKEYAARGTYIYPPEPSMRLITDLFAYCGEHVPTLEHDLDQRVPHARGGLDRRAGDRVHARRRHRLRAGGARRRPRRSTTSRRACRSSSHATCTSSRRSRSSAPPGACGRASCASGSRRRIRGAGCFGSTRRPAARRSPRSSPR